MDYIGIVESLCQNGHLSVLDKFDAPAVCLEKGCNLPIVWTNYIDYANDYVNLLMEEYPAKYETCNLGHVHEMEPARYRLLSEEEIGNLTYEQTRTI